MSHKSTSRQIISMPANNAGIDFILLRNMGKCKNEEIEIIGNYWMAGIKSLFSSILNIRISLTHEESQGYSVESL